MIELEQETTKTQSSPVVSIKVVGVGGAGGNTVNSIIESGYHGIDCLAVNTDAQALGISKANIKIQLGVKSTKGMGTGANPELGKRAAEEDLDKVMDVLEGSDIVFLAAGMGGGTGSGALPVIARALKEQGILSIAVVTKPFEFEGKRRTEAANDAIDLIKKEVDTLLVIPNQKLLDVTDRNVSMIDAFALINNILSQSVKGISEIITYPGHMNVDFADVRAIMKDMGMAVMGTGTATGQERAAEATLEAITSPLLENMSIKGARGVLLNITGGRNLGLHEISEAASLIYEQADEDARIILGSVIDESMDEEVTVTIIATGFDEKSIEDVVCDLQVAATVIAEKEPVLEAVPQDNLSDEAIAKTEAPVEAEEKEQVPVEIELGTEHDIAFEKSAQHELAASAKDEKTTPLINLDDLDVPTFLRKSVQENLENEKTD
ncbi:cell division protein FtsZ [Candidatus Dependentiae bacterium]